MATMELVRNVPRPTAVVRERVRLEDIPAFVGGAFDTVCDALKRQDVHVAGPPFALYRGTPVDGIEVEAGFPVTAEAAPDGAVQPSSLPGGEAVEAVHAGPYETLNATYREMAAWMHEHKCRPGDLMWEAYLTDPDDPHHPDGPRTLVVWPVRS